MFSLFNGAIKRNVLNRNPLVVEVVEQVREKLVILRAPANEFGYINKMEKLSVQRTNEILDRNKGIPLMKKPVMTPDGIRVGKLVMPPAPRD
jgi:hypothetical protein